MNFLEYFGVDTSKYEYLELITDFTISVSDKYDHMKYISPYINGITYFYDLIIDNINKDNSYCNVLYTLLVKDTSICRKLILKSIGSYAISYDEEDIRDTSNSYSFASSDILYYNINRHTRIVKVLICKDFIELYFNLSCYIDHCNTLTIDTTKPVLRAWKVPDDCYVRHVSTISSRYQLKEDFKNKMNFLEYFGVDTSRDEYLLLLTDFKIGTTDINRGSSYKDGKQIYHFDLRFFNLNSDNKYISKLYKIFLYGRKNIKTHYCKSHFGSYLDLYGYEITINTDTNISGFHNSYFTEYDMCSTIIDMYHETSITKVLISKNTIHLIYDKRNIYNDWLINPNKIYTVDTTKPSYKAWKVPDNCYVRSVSSISSGYQLKEKIKNKMNFLEYFGVDTTKYSSLYLTTDFGLKPVDLERYDNNPNFFYNLNIYYSNSDKSKYIDILYKFLTENDNQYLKEITLLDHDLKTCGYRVSYSCSLLSFRNYVSNNYPYDFLKYRWEVMEDVDPRNIKRVKITESYIDLYFDDTEFKYDDNMLEVYYDQKSSICVGGINNGLKQISYEEYMEKSINGEPTGSYLVTGVPDNYSISHRFLDLMSMKLKDEVNNKILCDLEGPQPNSISNKENKDSMNKLQVKSEAMEVTYLKPKHPTKNDRTYPCIVLDSLPSSVSNNMTYKVATTSDYLFNEAFSIEEIKFRDKGGTTIVFWKDGTKTVLKRQKGEKNDIEKVVAMAYMKKALSMMPTAKLRDMSSIITYAKVKCWQDEVEAKKIEEKKAKKAAKKKQKQEEAKLKEESKKKSTRRSSKK